MAARAAIAILVALAPGTGASRRGSYSDQNTINGQPPDNSDFSDTGPSMFNQHLDVFGMPADADTWSTEPIAGKGWEKMKVILTSDLFSTGKTKPVLMKVLQEMLGHKKNLKAVWIHDARAGWGDFDMAQVWLMDTVPELWDLGKCGVTQDVGLWIDRWNNHKNMSLSKNLGWSALPGGGFKPTTLAEVKKHLDESSILYVPGGNPFTLMKNLRSEDGHEVWQYALEKIRRGELVYLSRSAGTIVAGITADTSSDPRPSEEWTKEDLAGMDLLPWSLAFRPHYHTFRNQKWEPHDADWRRSHSARKWSHDDFLEALAENHPGVRGVRLRDGDFAAFYQGRLAVMHGDESVKSDYDDVTAFFQTSEGKSLTAVMLADGKTYHCCCHVHRLHQACRLRTEACRSGQVDWDYALKLGPVSFLAGAVENRGRCVVPHSDVKDIKVS